MYLFALIIILLNTLYGCQPYISIRRDSNILHKKNVLIKNLSETTEYTGSIVSDDVSVSQVITSQQQQRQQIKKETTQRFSNANGF